MNLQDKLKARILSTPGQWISFAEWMQQCLYDPEGGYYRSGPRIGKAGDYFTSSSVGVIFGQMIGEAVIELLRQLPCFTVRILELGGGDGRLAKDVLDTMAERAPGLYRHLEFYVLEQSPYHLGLQQQRLGEHQSRIVYVKGLDDPLLRNFCGVIFSNEFFDALPVHVLEAKEGRWTEVGVRWDEKRARFEEATSPAPSQEALRLVARIPVELEEGRRIEANVEAVEWMRQLGKLLMQGYILTIDYGLKREEYRMAHRFKGTLRGFYKHHLTTDLLSYPGEQDLTADVNFSELLSCAKQEGVQTVLCQTQKDFLLSMGILQNLTAGIDDPFGPAARRNRAIMQLVFEEWGMGQRFYVLLQKKGVPAPGRFTSPPNFVPVDGITSVGGLTQRHDKKHPVV